MTDAELLDAALSLLVSFEVEMPCDILTDVDDICADTCAYSYPQKECWRRYLEHKAKEG